METTPYQQLREAQANVLQHERVKAYEKLIESSPFPLATIEKAAESIGVTVDTANGWIRKHPEEFPTVKLGKRRLINVAKLQELLLSGVFNQH